MFKQRQRLLQWWFGQPKIRQVLWLITLVGWLTLLWLAVRPTGQAVYRLSNQSGSYFIHKLGPSARWSDDRSLTLVGQPAYFYLRPSRQFQQAKVKVTWQTRFQPTYLEVGILTDRANWRYQTQPLNHEGLNQLNWSRLSQGDLSLWQKEPIYKNWTEFLDQPPPAQQLATYYWLADNLLISPPADYSPSSVWHELPGQWRGRQVLVMYLADNEELAWQLLVTSDSFSELTASERVIVANVFDHNQQLLWSETRQLDDQLLAWLIKTGPWSAGAYRLEIIASSKLLFNLATQQTTWSWLDQVWPVAPPGEQWLMSTTANHLAVQTIQPTSCQTIMINQQPLDINQTYHQYQVAMDQPINTIRFQGGDLQLAGSGLFSLSSEIFSPQPYSANYLSAEQLTNFDAVVANYQLPDCDQQFCSATAELSLSGADWQVGDGYQIIISADYSQLSSTSPLIIKDIKITLQGSSLWAKLSSLLNQFWSKIRQ